MNPSYIQLIIGLFLLIPTKIPPTTPEKNNDGISNESISKESENIIPNTKITNAPINNVWRRNSISP